MNTKAFDIWTLAHIGSGLIAGGLGMRPSTALGGAVAYEFIEQGIERTKAGQKFFGSDGPESLLNAVTDVAVFAGGYYLMRGKL